jgi:ssDNA-binding Zn-finger/Zn-ribbon topoisomerase 1
MDNVVRLAVTDYSTMALRSVDPLNQNQGDKRQDNPAVANCPICDGKMEVVYQRNNQQVVVCADCHSGLTVPSTAWDIVRIKKQSKWMPKP